MSLNFETIEGKSRGYNTLLAILIVLSAAGFVSFMVSYIEGHQLLGSSNLDPMGIAHRGRHLSDRTERRLSHPLFADLRVWEGRVQADQPGRCLSGHRADLRGHGGDRPRPGEAGENVAPLHVLRAE